MILQMDDNSSKKKLSIKYFKSFLIIDREQSKYNLFEFSLDLVQTLYCKKVFKHTSSKLLPKY